MAEGTESPSPAKVRELIFAYERHSNSTKPLEEYTGRPRAKSIGNTLSYKMFRQANLEFHSIIDIEKELVKIEAHLNYYEVYDKATHVAFQEQLFNVLTSIVNIDPEDQDSAVQLKRKLIVETQKLATDLNSRLPYDGSHSYKGVRRTYNSYVRKEEAVVSTTSVKSSEHRAILSSQSSLSHTLNDGFKSDESLNSTRDSIDLSLRQGESSSVDLNYLEDRPQSSTPPPQKPIADETQTSLIPSVSKLKQFFSFRRETKPEVKVTSASYSGLSRSQSLNVKTNKYTIYKKSKKEDTRKQEEVISESDEGKEKNDDQEISSTQELHTSEPFNASQSVDKTDYAYALYSPDYIEPVKEHNTATHNVSVSKLKGLFEINQTETNEGLGLLTKKQNEFSSDFNLPFNAMNLGAYRLKRTISGNYMNFTGLLRNVDIEKKGDLSKSKSLSDLKITNFSYGAKHLENDDDLSKELDDNEDYEHVSIDVRKELEEVNNNISNNDDSENDVDKEHTNDLPIQLKVGSINAEEQSTQDVSTSVTSETVQRESKTVFLSKSVETLKQAFENLSARSEQSSKEVKEDEKYVLHKTLIEPVESNSSVVVEPVLKVPIQFRTGVKIVNSSEAVIENSSSSTVTREDNDDIRHILHRTIEPISSTTDEEPKLKVPIQLRFGLAKGHQSQKVSEAIIETKGTVTVDREVSVYHQSEPVLSIPVQLKDEGKETEEAVTETETTVTVDKDVSIQHQGEPVLKIPVQLKVGRENNEELSDVTKKFIYNEKAAHETSQIESSDNSVQTIKQTYDNAISTQNSKLSNEEIRYTLHRTIEPISSSHKDVEEPVLKVPIQLRIGLSNGDRSNTARERETVESNIQNEQTSDEASETFSSTGTVETLIETYETIGSTSELNNEEIQHVLHRTVEPSNVTTTEEPILKVPIQLRTFADANSEVAKLETNIQNEQISYEAHQTFSPVGIVETRIGTFENSERVQKTTDNADIFGVSEVFLHNEKRHSHNVHESTRPTSNREVNNEEIKHILHRSIEPGSTNAEDTKEPVLKVPIQLRTFPAVNDSHKDPDTIETTFEQSEQTSHETNETLSSGEIVEMRVETYGSTISTEANNEAIKNTIHRTIDPSSIDIKYVDEPMLEKPIELRTLTAENYSHEITGEDKTSKSGIIVEATSEPLASPGTVETLTQTFENLNSTTSTVGTDVEDIEHIIHRTIDPILFKDNGKKEPVIKVPIQLRTGFDSISGFHEVLENSEGVQETTESKEISETTETFLHNEKRHYHKVNGSSIADSKVNNKEIKHILHRTIEPSVTDVNDTEEPMLKAPIQLRTFSAVNYSDESTGDDTTLKSTTIVEATSESLSSQGTVETLAKSFENLSSTTSSTVPTNIEDIQHNIHRTIEPIPSNDDGTGEPVLKVQIQLRTGFATVSGFQEVIDNSEVTQNAIENTASSGVLETFLQNEKRHSYEVNESSISNSKVTSEEIKHNIHRTIEPGKEEPVLKVPIRLRTFEAVNHSKEGTESSIIDSEVNNEDIKHILHRTIEPSSIDVETTEEPVLKVPIQLRTFAPMNFSQEATDDTTLKSATTVEASSESLASPGTVETLTQTFENLNSTTNTAQTNIEDIQHNMHRTIETIPFKDNSTEEPVVKLLPIQLRANFATNIGSNEVLESSEGMRKTTENTHIFGATEAFLHNEKRHSHKVNEHFGTSAIGEGTIIETRSDQAIVKIPIDLRNSFTNEHNLQNEVLETEKNSGDVFISTANIDKHEEVPIVDVAYYSNGQDETFKSKDGKMSRYRIEERTGSFMKLLDSPTEFSTSVSGSSFGHTQLASSTSNVSVSYSQNKSVQRTSSTHISKRIVSTSSSSSSSQQSSQNYIQDVGQPTSYTLLKSLSPQNQDKDSSVTITEVGGEVDSKRKLKTNLTVSQENIIDEILRETDLLENVDEEFERVLEANTK